MTQQLFDILKQRLQSPLPGRAAQMKMTSLPSERQVPPGVYPRKAGVLVLLFRRNGHWHLPLIQRPTYPGVHSGQMAFPGGQYEKQDADLVETALRETHEEIGVVVERQQVVGQLSDLYIPPSNNLVTPVLAITNQLPAYQPDPLEVAKVVEAPLPVLQDTANQRPVKLELETGIKVQVPSYQVEGHTVWGATAMMLSELLEILAELGIED